MMTRFAVALLLSTLPAAAESGMGSWYGPGYYGHRTACGQILTNSSIWAAHKTLPCGTSIRVTNPKTGATIVVQVEDRGPYVRGWIVDLTSRAAQVIGMQSTIPVMVDVLR
jgi:rare lipoprotein A